VTRPASTSLQARVRAARLFSMVLLVAAVLITGTMLWRGLQPRLQGDVRRDLLLDAAHVRLLDGFGDMDTLLAWSDEKATNPDRAEVALPVRRNCALEWDVDARPGRFTMGFARLIVGPAADATPCTITITALGATSIPAAPMQAVPLPCPARDDAHPARWREGPAGSVTIELPEGARTIRVEVSSPGSGADAAPDGAWLALLSPRLEQAPLQRSMAEAKRTILDEHRLLPAVPAVELGAPEVLFATRRSAEAPEDRHEVSHPPVQALAAFTGKAGRPAVALTGEATAAWEVELHADSVLRGALALDDRLPPGARATLEVRVDGAVVASEPVDSVHWRELSVPLGAHAGAARRLECALVSPVLEPAEVAHDDPDFELGVNLAWGYTARVVRLGLSDPRLVRSREVPLRRATTGRPSVILIQVETLRADALGAPEAGGPSHTPELDAFAAHSTVWRQAFTPAPWTLPTTVSLLTGLLPSAHGAVDNDRLVVPGGVATLAERAGAAGVATGAVVASDLLRPQAGFARGFDSYVHVPYANARQVNDLAGAFLANHAGGQFLLFLHYFDPHSPCNAPGEWRERFLDPELRGRDVFEVQSRVKTELESAVRHGRAPAPREDDVRFLRQRYAGEVAWFDSQFGALLRRIDALGLAGDTLIVLTSDHGEEFFEHGLYGHGSAVFDETLHVPLIVSGPRGLPGLSLAGTAITTPVNTVSLFASVLGWLDVPFDAASVRPPLDAPERAVYGETSKGIALGIGGDPLRRHLHRVRDPAGLLTWHEAVGEEPKPGERAYYDLAGDPGALSPLPADGAAADALWAELQRAVNWCSEHEVASPLPGGDSGLMETLKQLGYIGAPPAPKTPPEPAAPGGGR
jgi:arylsulfatase A-like enzyme